MEELHFSSKPQVWQGTASQGEQRRVGLPDFCPVHRLCDECDALVLLCTLHANSYDQTSQMLLTCWIRTQQFVRVQWPSVWDFGRLGSWRGCQASKNPRLRDKLCFLHLDRIFGWKKKTHLWSSSNKRICPTEKDDAFAKEKEKSLQGRLKHPQTWVEGSHYRLAISMWMLLLCRHLFTIANPRWEWEALEKTKYSAEYESTETTYKKRWLKREAVLSTEVRVTDKSPLPLSILLAHLCMSWTNLKEMQKDQVFSSGTEHNPNRESHTQTWTTPRITHRQVWLLQGAGCHWLSRYGLCNRMTTL